MNDQHIKFRKILADAWDEMEELKSEGYIPPIIAENCLKESWFCMSGVVNDGSYEEKFFLKRIILCIENQLKGKGWKI